MRTIFDNKDNSPTMNEIKFRVLSTNNQGFLNLASDKKIRSTVTQITQRTLFSFRAWRVSYFLRVFAVLSVWEPYSIKIGFPLFSCSPVSSLPFPRATHCKNRVCVPKPDMIWWHYFKYIVSEMFSRKCNLYTLLLELVHFLFGKSQKRIAERLIYIVDRRKESASSQEKERKAQWKKP